MLDILVLCVCVCVCVHAHVRMCAHVYSFTQQCPALCDLMDCSPPASLSMEFSRQESWCGLPSPSPGIFLTQGRDQVSCFSGDRLHWQAGSLLLSHQGSQVNVGGESCQNNEIPTRKISPEPLGSLHFYDLHFSAKHQRLNLSQFPPQKQISKSGYGDNIVAVSIDTLIMMSIYVSLLFQTPLYISPTHQLVQSQKLTKNSYRRTILVTPY